MAAFNESIIYLLFLVDDFLSLLYISFYLVEFVLLRIDKPLILEKLLVQQFLRFSSRLDFGKVCSEPAIIEIQIIYCLFLLFRKLTATLVRNE